MAVTSRSSSSRGHDHDDGRLLCQRRSRLGKFFNSVGWSPSWAKRKTKGFIVEDFFKGELKPTTR